MRIHRDHSTIKEIRNGVLTIGTFDGVHLGHQELISRINELKQDINGESVILTFDPHPRLLLNPDQNLEMITSLDEKLALLEKFGIDHVIIQPFSRNFSELTAESYVNDFLLGVINPKIIVIGYDHKFGKDRVGNFDLMSGLCKVKDIMVLEISAKNMEDIIISSTSIREALISGNIDRVNNLLGHTFTLKGTVVKGEGRGKDLSFPTANVQVLSKHKLIPANGVYAAVGVIDGKDYPGMLNIGTRPTFDGRNRSIELHMFDFDRDIYGEPITVKLVSRWRDEVRFDSVQELIDQLQNDLLGIRNLLDSVN